HMGLESIFVLTTRTMHWFLKRGFVQVPIDWLPQARLRKYSPDRKSVVLVKKLPAN
ncbi:MAG: N-acetylglutamate synthase, partial [Betaproteobacteria bacterium]|nr:N-acetylglutamate synthase [Betaproteobacteria bacterium]